MLTSCTSWLSKCRTPRTGDVGRSPTAPASLSAASPPVTPAEPAVTDQQVLYPDEHAQKLAELEPIPYHMPETAVAPLLDSGDGQHYWSQDALLTQKRKPNPPP